MSEPEVLNRTLLLKMHAAAPLLGEPGCIEIRKCIDALLEERVRARIGWESARAAAIRCGMTATEKAADAAIEKLCELDR